jgi:hypothetical protein
MCLAPWILDTNASIKEGNATTLHLIPNYADIFDSKIDELEKQLVTLRDAVQSQHPPVIVANLSTDVVGPVTVSHGANIAPNFAPPLSQSSHTSIGSQYTTSSNVALAVNHGARPAAQSIRAIDSMAFSLEEIDLLFNL